MLNAECRIQNAETLTLSSHSLLSLSPLTLPWRKLNTYYLFDGYWGT